MATNVSPEYRKAEQAYKKARSTDEKVSALREMLRTIPKHKGTEKLQADIKRRLARHREQEEQEAKKRGFSVHVPREGAAQLALLGAPNAGKSRLAAALSGVDLEHADYPYTTHRPQPVIAHYEDVPMQLVDLPPVSKEHTESWIGSLARNADLLLLVVDAAHPDALESVEETVDVLREMRIEPIGDGEPNSPSNSQRRMRSLLVGTRLDVDGAGDSLAVLLELYDQRLGVRGVSAETGAGLDALRETLFRRLHLVRVYSKPPHHDPELDRPYVLSAGATIGDFAQQVHRDLADNLKFARVWGEGKFDGQRVHRDHALADRDVVELHG
jgi:hypothetical protein